MLEILSSLAIYFPDRQGKENALSCIKELVETGKISSIGDQVIYDAAHSSSPDFEDALQIAATEMSEAAEDTQRSSGSTSSVLVQTP